MASKTEGIALLSMYNDEEEEEEEEEPEQPRRQSPRLEEPDQVSSSSSEEGEVEDEERRTTIASASPQKAPPSPLMPPPSSKTPPSAPYATDAGRNPKPSESPMDIEPSPQHHPLRLSRPSTPLSAVAAANSSRDAAEAPAQRKRAAVAIVDYAHDENALSPEPEEGEMVADLDTLDADLQDVDGSYEDRSSPGSVHGVNPSTQATPQSYEQPEATKCEASMTVDSTGKEADVSPSDKELDVSMEMQEDVDLLKHFLPALPPTKCSPELQEKINKFLSLKRAGKSFNTELRNMKAYRNPDFLQHAVRYQEINQIGTCFSKDVFDPEGYIKGDYYDEIEAEMKRELEKKELERKRSPKVEFVPGSAQTGVVAPVSKTSAQIPVSGAAISNVQTSVLASTEVSTKEGRQNKKSKWDKVDIDPKNPLQSGGTNIISSIVHSTTIMSAANIGTGYSAFAQQKRKESEEKQSNDRRHDKRS